MEDIALDDRIIIHDVLDLAIQEIDILLNTTPTNLIGNCGFGVDLEQYLWTLTPTTEDLQQYIIDKIANNTIIANNLQHEVNCTFYKGVIRSIYVIEIRLHDENGNTAYRKYQYQ